MAVNRRSFSRKNRTRKNRKVNRKRSRRQAGGGATKSDFQGGDYLSYHSAQHGGAQLLGSAPVGHTGLLDASLRDSARLGGYDAHFREASGLSDGGGAAPPNVPPQAGGRRRTGRKNRRNVTGRNNRRNVTGRKNRRNVTGRKNRRNVTGRKNRRNRKCNRKNRSNRSNRSNRNNRSNKRNAKNQQGGFAPVDQRTMLLDGGEYARAGTADFNVGRAFAK